MDGKIKAVKDKLALAVVAAKEAKDKLALAAIAAITAAHSATASADDLGTVAGRINQGIQGTTSLIGAIAYLFAFIMVLIAVFKFKKHSDNPDQHSLAPVVWLVVGAVFAAYVPSVFDMGADTIWGNGGGQSQGVGGNNMPNL